MTKVVSLFLMNRKGLAVLDGVISAFGPGSVSRVVGARDGAVEHDYFDEIRDLAVAHAIPFYDRPDAVSPARDEVCVAVGWRWLIQDTDRLIVLHDSLLPRYRGFAPVVSCLINGERSVGATALLASAGGYDEGDVLAQVELPVRYPVTIATIIDRLSPVYVRLVTQVFECIVAGAELVGKPQDHAAATYSLWRDEEDYRIDWNRSAQWIRRMVDAVGYPYRGALTELDNARARILEAEERPDVIVENRAPGKVIFMDSGRPVVVCGEGLLRIDRLVDDSSGESLLPLSRFRLRFG